MPKVKKMLMIFTSPDLLRPSGTASTLREISQILAELGPTLALVPTGDFDQSMVSSYRSIRRYHHFPSKFFVLMDLSLPFLYSLRTTLKDEKPEIVLSSFLSGTFAVTSMLRPHAKYVHIAHIVERDFRAIALAGKGASVLLRGLIGRWIAFRECFVLRRSDHIICVSKSDRDRLMELYDLPQSKFTVLQLCNNELLTLPLQQKRLARARMGLPADAAIVLFHGSYNHFPNREAIERIRLRIAPMTAARLPNVQFLIAGTDVPMQTETNVRHLGYVRDLPRLIDSADMAIVPVTTGGGVRLKMIDYFCRGLPVVSTKEAAQGLSCTNGKELLIAESDEEFVARIIELHSDKKLSESISQEAREYALRCFSRTEAKDRLQRAFESQLL